VRDRRALYVDGDVFLTSRRVQLATLAATNRIPASYPSRETVQAGGLMGYATDRVSMYRQVGTYAGQILKGAKPADYVIQPIEFEFVINCRRPGHSASQCPRRYSPAPRGDGMNTHRYWMSSNQTKANVYDSAGRRRTAARISSGRFLAPSLRLRWRQVLTTVL
jgi:hypothetical protein